MADHSIKIEDANGKLHAYTSSNDHSAEYNREAAMRAFDKDAEHNFVAGPGKVVGHSSVDLDVLK